MPSRIEKDIGERVSHLSGGAKDVGVIAVFEHRSATLEDAIRGPRQSRSDRLHAAPQGRRAICFHKKVDVVGLKRVVDHAEVTLLARMPKGAFHLAHEPDRTERWNVAAYPQRDVARMSSLERDASEMGHSRSRSRLSTCSPAAAAPPEVRDEIEIHLHRELDSSDVPGKCQHLIVFY